MKTLPLDRCKQRLAAVWLVSSGVLFAVVLIQSVLGHYGDSLEAAWGWFLPTVVPTASLMIGALVADAGATNKRPQFVQSFFFSLAFWLSIFYLVVAAATLLAQPIASPAGQAVQYLKTSNLWLAPLQGFVTAALGAFFVKIDAVDNRTRQENADPKRNPSRT